MTALTPMRPERYAAYLEAAIAGYAEDSIACGRWPADKAGELSRADFMALLPQGLATPDDHLFEIVDTEGGSSLGTLWFAVEDRHGVRGAFVYDLEVRPEYRRLGHAERAFGLLEAIVLALGLPHIGLHVFAQNQGAQDLYRKLGYTVTGLNMHKKLVPPA